MHRFLLRQAGMNDIEGIQRLAHLLNTVNLPDEEHALQEVIEKSSKSFAGAISNPFEREYVFVAEDLVTKQIVGSSQVIAQHGTRQAPHTFFDVYNAEHYSKTMDRLFKHRVLRLGLNYDGPTEIGGLVVHPEYRRLGDAKLGKQLSYVRFMFMAMHRELFRSHVLAELLPPFLPGGLSLFWEALGRKFTGLSYLEADRVSRNNKEFIKSLFPEGPIYTTLFGDDVQAVIGAIGDESKPAAGLLESIGFAYSNRIDPFDGGPHYEAAIDDISPVNDTKRVKLLPADGHSLTSHGLIATFASPFLGQAAFKAVYAPFANSVDKGAIHVEEDVLNLLDAGSLPAHVLPF